MNCVKEIAVIMESTTPSPSVIAKPRIEPVPNMKSTIDAMMVVMFESKIVVNAR